MLARKGEWYYTVFSVIFGLIVVLSFLSFTGTLDTSSAGGIGTVWNTFKDIGSSLFDGLFKLVAPSGVDENTQYIAFSLFLLVWVIGSYSLQNVGFFSPTLSFITSGIIGMIASRSLTTKIIQDSNLAGGPLTAAIFLLAAFPLIFAKGILDRVYKNKESDIFFMSRNSTKRRIIVWRMTVVRMVIWALLAYTYYFVVKYVISQGNGQGLSIVYGLAALLFGFFDSFKRYRADMLTEQEAQEAGRGIAQAKKTIKEAEALLKGEQEGVSRS